MADKLLVRYLNAGLVLVVVGVLGVGTPSSWSGVGLFTCLAAFSLAGAALVPRRFLDVGDDPDLARVFAMAIAGGLALACALWTASAYLFADYAPGTVGLGLTALVGAFRMRRRGGWVVGLVSSRDVFLVLAVSLFIGCYVFGANELVVDDQYLYTFRYDWGTHLYSAALIREHGLPALHSAGQPGLLHASVSHVGLQVMLGGIEQLTQTTLVNAARTFGITCFAVISLAGFALTRGFSLGRGSRIVAATSPLFWGGLTLPFALRELSLEGVFDPYQHGVFTGAASSGTLYHNLPQAGAVALAAASLVALEAYSRERRLDTFVLAALTLVASGLVKPSTVIVLAPALLIVMAVKRERPAAFAVLAGFLLAGAAVYFLPRLGGFEPAAGAHGWEFGWSFLTDGGALANRLAMLGVGWVVVGFVAVGFLATIARPRDWRWQEVATLALFGGAVFSLMFREVGRTFHGNHVWSMHSAVVLLAPYLSARVLGWIGSAERPGAFRFLLPPARALLAILFAFQLVGALFYTLSYPFHGAQRVDGSRVEALEMARELTDPEARFLIAPSLNKMDTLHYLGRRVLRAGQKTRQSTLEEAEAWRSILSSKRKKGIREFISRRDAVILGRGGFHLRKLLKAMKWKRKKICSMGDYELWVS